MTNTDPTRRRNTLFLVVGDVETTLNPGDDDMQPTTSERTMRVVWAADEEEACSLFRDSLFREDLEMFTSCVKMVSCLNVVAHPAIGCY